MKLAGQRSPDARRAEQLKRTQELLVLAGMKLGSGHILFIFGKDGRRLCRQLRFDFRSNSLVPDGLPGGRQPFLDSQQQRRAARHSKFVEDCACLKRG